MMEALSEVTTQSRSRSIYLKKKNQNKTKNKTKQNKNKQTNKKHSLNSGTRRVQWYVHFTNTNNHLNITKYLQIQVISSSSRTFTKYTANKTACQCGDESLWVSMLFSKDFYTNYSRADEQCKLGQ